jgi:hypothetical protein
MKQTIINEENLRKLFGWKTDEGELEETEDDLFLKKIDPTLDQITDEHREGLRIAKEMAASYGCTLELTLKVEEKPLDIKNEEPRIIFHKPKPTPVRKNDPMYEDIKNLSLLFERDRVLELIEEGEKVAQDLGKSFCHLTVEDLPCDYFYEDFMRGPSLPKIDKKEQLYYDAFEAIEIPEGCSKLTTIWAENSKAFGRYAALGFDEIEVLYPENYSMDNYKNYKKYALERYPGLEISRKIIASEQDLLQMNAEEFMDRYKLDCDSYFFINYLPQFMHLRYGFNNFMCVYSSTDILLTGEKFIMPEIDLPHAALMDYYSIWMNENRPDIVEKGHGALCDPLSRKILAYSQHGCFIDHIRDASDFGEGQFVDQTLASFAGKDSDSRLRIVHSFREMDHEEELESWNSYDYDNVDAVDISWMELPSDTVYMPAVPCFELKTTEAGTFVHKGIVYSGFPKSERTIKCIEHEDIVYVLDISYSRRKFFSRRNMIPEGLRVPISHLMRWHHCYAVLVESWSQVDKYKVSPTIKMSPDRVNPVTLRETVIPGVAWNSIRNALVFDETKYLYASPIEVDYQAERTRYYEFDNQYAVRKAKRFQMGDIYVEIPASRSEQMVLPFYFEDVILKSFDERYRISFYEEMLPSFRDNLEFYFSDDDIGSEDEFAMDKDSSMTGQTEMFEDMLGMDPVNVLDYIKMETLNSFEALDFVFYLMGEKCSKSSGDFEIYPSITGSFYVKDGRTDHYHRVDMVYLEN